MINVVAGIVLFNPNIDRLKEVLSSIKDQVKEIILVDNNSNNKVDIEKVCTLYPNIKIIYNNKNLGIGAALNQIFQLAEKNNYNYVITLDHDTVCPENMVTAYTSILDKIECGLICPNVIDKNIVKNKYYSDSKNTEYEKVNRCIQAGCLIKLSAWKQVGGFDESMFIDFVDFDFCEKLYIAHICMVRANRVVVDHELGHQKKTIFAKFFSNNEGGIFRYLTYRNVFSKARSFYTARNNLIYIKKFSSYIDVKKENKAMRIRIIKRVVRGVHPIMILTESINGIRAAKKMNIKRYHLTKKGKDK